MEREREDVAGLYMLGISEEPQHCVDVPFFCKSEVLPVL
jgi:hypothetical protein